MPINVTGKSFRLSKCMDFFAGVWIPQTNCFIIRCCCNHVTIRRKPIICKMYADSLHKALGQGYIICIASLLVRCICIWRTYRAHRTQFVCPMKHRTNLWDCGPLRTTDHNFAVLSSDAVRTFKMKRKVN